MLKKQLGTSTFWCGLRVVLKPVEIHDNTVVLAMVWEGRFDASQIPGGVATVALFSRQTDFVAVKKMLWHSDKHLANNLLYHRAAMGGGHAARILCLLQS